MTGDRLQLQEFVVPWRIVVLQARWPTPRARPAASSECRRPSRVAAQVSRRWRRRCKWAWGHLTEAVRCAWPEELRPEFVSAWPRAPAVELRQQHQTNSWNQFRSKWPGCSGSAAWMSLPMRYTWRRPLEPVGRRTRGEGHSSARARWQPARQPARRWCCALEAAGGVRVPPGEAGKLHVLRSERMSLYSH